MSRLTQDGDGESAREKKKQRQAPSSNEGHDTRACPKVTVVVGRGRSGWRKLFGRSSASKPSPSTTATPPPPPPHTTDLRKLEPVNDEQHYMTACARRRTAEQERERKRESATAVSHAGHASPSLEFEETGVVAADPAREHHHHHHHRKTRAPEPEAATPDVEEEPEPELDATHDMFADAGKFLLAGGMAGAGECGRCYSALREQVRLTSANARSLSHGDSPVRPPQSLLDHLPGFQNRRYGRVRQEATPRSRELDRGGQDGVPIGRRRQGVLDRERAQHCQDLSGERASTLCILSS